jgi:hypothetical protein
MSLSVRFRAAFKATLLHLLLSFFVVGMAAVLVFGIWYPAPYSELLGGKNLFLLIAVVDLVCGPLLTAILFNPEKSFKTLMVDLGLVALIQISALMYGLYSVASARPVYLVFQVNDFRAIAATEVDINDLSNAPVPLQSLPWLGPRAIGTRSPIDAAERMSAMQFALGGLEISLRPSWWQDYSLNRTEVLKSAKPINMLIERQPTKKKTLDSAITKTGFTESSLLWVPLVSRQSMDWVVLVDKTTAEIRGFAHVDGYEIEAANEK